MAYQGETLAGGLNEERDVRGGKKGTMGRRTNTKGHLRIHMETHY